MLNSTSSEKRIWVKGLSLECPLGNALDDCPMNSLRHLMTSQLNGTINSLNEDQLHNVIKVHEHGLIDRLNAVEQKTRPQ